MQLLYGHAVLKHTYTVRQQKTKAINNSAEFSWVLQ